MSSVKNWLLATRPHTLTASIAPVLIGSALAAHTARTQALTLPNFWLLLSLCLLCAISLQIAVNLGNDYFDYRNGVDNEHHLGAKSTIVAGKISASEVLKGTFVTLFIGTASGLVLCLLSQPVLLVFGIVCVVSVWAYSGGPFPLAYNALGELAVFCVFGPIAVIGSYYVQLGNITTSLWLPSAQMGLYAAAIMLINNTRDIRSDSAAGKNTLATLMGETICRLLYKIIMLAALLCTIGYFFTTQQTAVSSYLIAPATLLLIIQINRRQDKALNAQLSGTAQLMLIAALCLCLDVLWASPLLHDAIG